MNIPLRMCIACREMKPKTVLLRLVRNADGMADLAPHGHFDGRSAYLCPSPACIQKAEKSRGAERALKCAASEGLYGRLKEVAEDA